MIWLGVPIYDDRYDQVPEYIAIDWAGSNKLIYTLSSKEAGTTSSHSGNWQNVSLDLLPYMIKGLKYAYDHKMIKEYRPELFSIVNMNLGWEVPGRNIVTAKIKELTCEALYL